MPTDRRWSDGDRELVAAGTWGGLDFNAVKLLVTHQRRDIGSCLCGWGVNTGDLGRSHALHVWLELQRAVLLDHDTRVRAETLDEAEQAILHEARLVGLDIDGADDSLLYIPAIRALRRIARAHRATDPGPAGTAPTWNPGPDPQHDPGPPANPSMFSAPVALPPAPDPTHGRIDRDIQAAVDSWGPSSLGQRVAIENTTQTLRDRGEITADHCLNCHAPLVRRSGKLVHRDGDPDRCSAPAGTASCRCPAGCACEHSGPADVEPHENGGPYFDSGTEVA